MLRAADAGGAVTQLIRSCFRECDEIFDVLGRYRRMHHNNSGYLCEIRDVYEVTHQIEIELGEERRVDCIRNCRHEERVTIGRRLRRNFCTNIRAAARTILDDVLLSP